MGNTRVTSRPACLSLADSHASAGFGALRKLRIVETSFKILRRLTEEEFEEGKGTRERFYQAVQCPLSPTSTEESVGSYYIEGVLSAA